MPTEVVRKAQLDGQVAELLDMKTSEVSLITAAFLKEVTKSLVRTGVVRLDGLGSLRVVLQHLKKPYPFEETSFTGKRGVLILRTKYFVRFKKATPLRDAIRARYGAGATKQKEKTNGKARSRRRREPGVLGEGSR